MAILPTFLSLLPDALALRPCRPIVRREKAAGVNPRPPPRRRFPGALRWGGMALAHVEWCRGRAEGPFAAEDARVAGVPRRPQKATTSGAIVRWEPVAAHCRPRDAAPAGDAGREAGVAARSDGGRQARRRRSGRGRAGRGSVRHAGAPIGGEEREREPAP